MTTTPTKSIFEAPVPLATKDTIEEDVFTDGDDDLDTVFFGEPEKKTKDDVAGLLDDLRQQGLSDEDIEQVHDLLQEDRENLNPSAGVPDLGISALESLLVDAHDETIRVHLPVVRERLVVKVGGEEELLELLEAARKRDPSTGLFDEHPCLIIRPRLRQRDVRAVAKVLDARQGSNAFYHFTNRSQMMACMALERWDGDLKLYQGADGIAEQLEQWQELGLRERFKLLDELPVEDLNRATGLTSAASVPTRRQRGN